MKLLFFNLTDLPIQAEGLPFQIAIQQNSGADYKTAFISPGRIQATVAGLRKQPEHLLLSKAAKPDSEFRGSSRKDKKSQNYRWTVWRSHLSFALLILMGMALLCYLVAALLDTWNPGNWSTKTQVLFWLVLGVNAVFLIYMLYKAEID